MHVKRKIGLTLLTMFMAVFVAISSAVAGELLIKNTLDTKILVAVVYCDDATKAWTTIGWYGIEGNTAKKLKLDKADTGKAVYAYAESKGIEYKDSNGGEQKIARWVRSESFTFTSPDKPAEGTNLKSVEFVECQASDEPGSFVVTLDNAVTAAQKPASTTPAATSPTEFVIQNTLGNDIDVSVAYYDITKRAYTTRGWYSVKAGQSRTLKFENVSPKSGVYFHAEANGAVYSDKRGDGKKYNRWISNSSFAYVGDEKPTEGKNIRSGVFFRCNELSGNTFNYRVDTVFSKPAPVAKKPASGSKAATGSQRPTASLSVSPDELLIGGRMKTTVTYTVKYAPDPNRECIVTLHLYNEKGKLIRRLIYDETNPLKDPSLGKLMKQGTRKLEFNARDLPYGDYTFKLTVQANFQKAAASTTLAVILRR